jgi:hypothetical protein
VNEVSENLESLLSHAPYVEDDGFTETLLKRLPPRRPSRRIRTLILLASALASGCVVMAVPGARRLLANAAFALVGDAAAIGSNLVVAGIVIGLAVWCTLAAARSDI